MKTYETKENPDRGMKEGNAPLSEISPRGNIINGIEGVNYYFRGQVDFFKHCLNLMISMQ